MSAPKALTGLGRAPISRKVTLVILATSTIVLLIATMAQFAFQLATFRSTIVRDAEVLSDVVATQSSVPVSFGFQKETEDILKALEAKPDFHYALIVGTNGAEFVSHGAPLDLQRWKPLPASGYRFVDDYLMEVRPIVSNLATNGTLYLISDYRTAYNRLVRFHLIVLAAVLAGSIFLALLLSNRLQRVVSDPILKLADTAKDIAEKKDYSARALKVGNDELGVFTDAFNQMLSQIQAQDAALQSARTELENRVAALQHEVEERERAEERLEEAHRNLLESSRKAGMAEVATGVLHNVGNVLNSVNVSTTLLRDSVRRSEVASVIKLAELLRSHEKELGAFLSADPKGRLIPQFLSSLAEQLSSERTSMLNEIELLARNIEHIKDIVAMQQNYARVAGVVEQVSIPSLVEDALRIHAAAMARHGVKVMRDFEPVPLVSVDKHKVLQIIVNLLHNAKYAVQESGEGDKSIVVRIRSTDAKWIQVGVEDDGIGIPKENLTQIFSHGFTTRLKGHGFGLHSSAVASQEIGGYLKAYSDGPGTGAKFILLIPVKDEGKKNESHD